MIKGIFETFSMPEKCYISYEYGSNSRKHFFVFIERHHKCYYIFKNKSVKLSST
jgi:hypothetical protein